MTEPTPRSQTIRRVIERTLTVAFILLHGWAAVSGVLRSTIVGEAFGLEALGGDMRKPINTYVVSTGAYQTWSMFAANPPKNTRWLEIEVHERRFEVPESEIAMGGEQNRSGIMITYDRTNKLERNLMKDSRHRGRVAFLNHYCAEQAEAGHPVERVSLVKVYRRTPSPKRAREVVETTRTNLLSLSCPR